MVWGGCVAPYRESPGLGEGASMVDIKRLSSVWLMRDSIDAGEAGSLYCVCTGFPPHSSAVCWSLQETFTRIPGVAALCAGQSTAILGISALPGCQVNCAFRLLQTVPPTYNCSLCCPNRYEGKQRDAEWYRSLRGAPVSLSGMKLRC